MIKFIQCIKARPGLSITDFRRYWERYEKVARAIAEATDSVGLSLSTTLAVQQNLEVQLERGTSDPFDGILEIRWPNASGLETALAKPDVAKNIESLQAMQEEFVDFDKSSFFFTSEKIVFEQPVEGLD